MSVLCAAVMGWAKVAMLRAPPKQFPAEPQRPKLSVACSARRLRELVAADAIVVGRRQGPRRALLFRGRALDYFGVQPGRRDEIDHVAPPLAHDDELGDAAALVRIRDLQPNIELALLLRRRQHLER